MRRFLSAWPLVLALAVTGLSQVTTGSIQGIVSDAQGGAIPGADIKVVNKLTGQTFTTLSNELGRWDLPAMPSATYSVSISLAGFRTAVIDNVKVDAGVPARLNATLEVGSVTDQVSVETGAEVLQTESATVQSTLVGQQLHELPFTSRNLTELIVTQPGSVTPGVPRSTSVYGLPQSALNVTLDGINIQDNSNKSSDGFFNAIFPRADAIEEMTISSAAAGADSNAEGALSMKMVTRSGTNAWHGGVFEQHRNQLFNSNSYFNSLNGLPRDHMVFNQFGGFAGGPIWRDRLFIFAHGEGFQLPQTYVEPVSLVLTPEAASGLFRYKDSSGNVRSVNLLQLAAANNFTSTPDPLIGASLSTIQQLTANAPGLKSRISTTSDYNRNSLDFQSKGGNYRRFGTSRLDYNVTPKHHIEFIYNYQTNLRRPDGVNLTTATPVFPGTGSVLNNKEDGNQGSIAFSAVAALRSTLTNRLVSEVRFGLTGGTVIFNNNVNPSDFNQWRGYAPSFGLLTPTTVYASNPYRNTGQNRRNTPLKQGNVNLTYSLSAHLLTFGGSFTQVNAWTTSVNGTQFIPTIAFGVATGDPIITGSTNMFTAANFPGANATDLQTNAPALYALLTGRVSTITRSVVLDEITKQYGAFPPTVRNYQREIGLYVQDLWHVRPNLSLNYGVRWDRQNPPVNMNDIYTRPGYAGVWGVSGIGNLFKPGTLTGQVPVFNSTAPNEAGYNPRNGQFSPSLGLSWKLPDIGGPLHWIVGNDSVIRAGYAINTLREDASTFAVWGNNQGRTVTLTVDPTNFPANFGPPGSVSFRDAVLPSRPAPTAPNFPLAVAAGNNVADFSPNLKTGYVQSWDIGLQRQLTRNTVLEVRYVGNHGTDLWRQVNLNEINVFENGFAAEARIAQQNLALARGCAPSDPVCMSVNRGKSNQYAGLAGQQPLQMITTALASNSDATSALQIEQGQAGILANAIATNTTRMGRLTAAGYPVNLFQVNPTLVSGNALLEVNGGDTKYNGLQLELRRRMSSGLLVQGSYVWSHSISNEQTQGIGGSYTTLHNVGYDKSPSPYDIRQAIKLNWLYELPVGKGHRFYGDTGNPIVRKLLENWQLASVTRIQSGSPIRLVSGRGTTNQNDAGVILHNLTASQLQDMMSIRKVTLPATPTSPPIGAVYYLPQAVVDNTNAAFELNGKTLVNLDPNAPYIGPADQIGQLGQRAFLYGPWQQKWDFSLLKKTYIHEQANVEFRVQALNAFNRTNFLLFVPGNGITTTLAVNNAAFGQTTGAYRDLSNTNDPGGRIVEFSLRFNF
jgi:Carboxypeptidase regulatory-like domain/TonB dependent receptor-like, beta-barrel